MKQVFVLISMLMLSAVMIFAAGQDDGGNSISIMYQGGEPEEKAVTAVLNRFEAATGIQVEARYTPTNFAERLAGYINSKDMPDIVQYDAANLFNYVWSGQVAPIDEYVSKAVANDMTESSIAAVTYPIDGKQYAVSHQDSTVVLYANRSYLEAVGARIPTSVDNPWTLAEFNKILSDLAELDEVTWPLDIMAAYGTRTEWATYGFSPILQSAGADLINRKTWQASGTLDSAEAIEVMETVQGWNEKGWLVPASAGDNQLYNDERAAAMAWCGHWLWPAVSSGLGDDAIALPLPDFGAGAASPNGSWVWGISESSENKELAGQLLEFIVTDEEFIDTLVELVVFPGLKSFRDKSPSFSDPDQMAIASAQSVTAVPRPPHPAYPVITQSFSVAFDDILGGADVRESLSRAARTIDEDIADNDGYPPFGN